MIYLDYAAATPLDDQIKTAMDKAQGLFANPSAQYRAAREAHEALETARRTVARYLGCTAAEVVFTSGGTEADNLAIFGLGRPYNGAGFRVLTSALEHAAVQAPVRRLVREGWRHTEVRLQPTGLIDLEHLRNNIDDTTALIAVTLASSEIGVIQDVTAIGRLVREVRDKRASRGLTVPLHLHCDASAAAEFVPINVHRLGVDTLSLNAAKLYGPKGSGALFVRRGTDLQPQIVGGGQQQGLRAGTENVAAAVGLAAAMTKAAEMRADGTKRLTQLRNYAIGAIMDVCPEARLNGHASKCLPNIINVSLPGLSGEDLVAYFDAENIAVATGAACAASDQRPSETLMALGIGEQLAQSSLRISLGRGTTKTELDRFLAVLQTVTAKLAAVSR